MEGPAQPATTYVSHLILGAQEGPDSTSGFVNLEE